MTIEEAKEVYPDIERIELQEIRDNGTN